MNCENEKNLILKYDPIDSENQVCSTNLTDLSTNCLLRQINQKKYFLRDKYFKIIGTLLKLENIVFLKEINLQDTLVNGVFTLRLPTGIEKYSFTTSFDYFYINERASNETTEIKLTSVSGNQSFNRVEWIIPPPSNKIPLPRTLIFKYIDEKK